MKKIVSAVLAHDFRPEHRGAPYFFNNCYMNSGEFIEYCVKAAYGFKPCKDSNTAYNNGADIAELGISVKSSKATLTSIELGKTKTEIINRYFETAIANAWAYGTIQDDALIIYIMDKAEFAMFLDNFSTVQKSSSKNGQKNIVRLKATSLKMLEWLEGQL